MEGVRVTRIGGPTTLIEMEGWRMLTDPTFDPPGRRYNFGWGTGSSKFGRTGARTGRLRGNRRGPAGAPRPGRSATRPVKETALNL